MVDENIGGAEHARVNASNVSTAPCSASLRVSAAGHMSIGQSVLEERSLCPSDWLHKWLMGTIGMTITSSCMHLRMNQSRDRKNSVWRSETSDVSCDYWIRKDRAHVEKGRSDGPQPTTLSKFPASHKSRGYSQAERNLESLICLQVDLFNRVANWRRTFPGWVVHGFKVGYVRQRRKHNGGTSNCPLPSVLLE